jgi:hypothetical protein
MSPAPAERIHARTADLANEVAEHPVLQRGRISPPRLNRVALRAFDPKKPAVDPAVAKEPVDDDRTPSEQGADHEFVKHDNLHREPVARRAQPRQVCFRMQKVGIPVVLVHCHCGFTITLTNGFGRVSRTDRKAATQASAMMAAMSAISVRVHKVGVTAFTPHSMR